MVKPAGSLSPITSQVCNTVLFEEGKRCLLNGSVSSFCKIVLHIRTSMYTWTKEESSMPILMSRTSLPTGTTKFILQEQTRPIRIDQSNALTDPLVIISVLSLNVLRLISNFGRMLSSTVFILSIPLLLLSKIPFVSSKLLERRRTLPIFAPLAVVSGSALRENAKLCLNPTHKRVFLWDLFPTPLETIFGTTVRQATLVQSIMSALMKA